MFERKKFLGVRSTLRKALLQRNVTTEREKRVVSVFKIIELTSLRSVRKLETLNRSGMIHDPTIINFCMGTLSTGIEFRSFLYSNTKTVENACFSVRQ